MKKRGFASALLGLGLVSFWASPAIAQRAGAVDKEVVFNVDGERRPDAPLVQVNYSNLNVPSRISYAEAGSDCVTMSGTGTGVGSALQWIDTPFSTLSAGRIYGNITGFVQLGNSNWNAANQGRTGVFLSCTIRDVTDPLNPTETNCSSQGFNLLWQAGRGSAATWTTTLGTSNFFHWGTRGSVAIQLSNEVAAGRDYVLRLQAYRAVDTTQGGTLPVTAFACNAKVMLLHP